MFKKTNLYLEGFLYNIKIKKINEDDLFEKKEYKEFDGEEILNQDFISLKDFFLKINNEENSESISDMSGVNAFLNEDEMKKENSVIQVDNLIAENLLEKIQEEFITMEITKYKFVSPKIKIKDKEFNKYKIKIETTDLEALTDSLIDEDVIYNITYDGKELNYRKQGLIFVDKITRKVISKEIATFNIDDYNPCLENKYKLKD
jgi:hypothetical protein